MGPDYKYLHLFDCQMMLLILAGISGGMQFNGYDGYLMEEEPYFDKVQAGVYYIVEFKPYYAQILNYN